MIPVHGNANSTSGHSSPFTVGDRPSQHDAALVLAVLDTIKGSATAQLADGKRIAAADYYKPGDRSVVVDPQTGEQLGLTWMTRPKPVAEIVDRDTLVGWAREQRPHDVEQTVSVRPGVDDEVVAVLAEHAPHLLTAPSWRLTEQGEAAILAAAKQRNADPVPGVEVRTPRGSITVKLDDGGAERIRELVSAGHVSPLLALPAASDTTGDEQGRGAA